jgi:2-polyprenyl-6-hydroxyphenyl methylase / 3-demethylubiquinone-9 3-methyltransferase
MLGIKVMQEWRMTRFIDAALHDWNMFIKPTELGEVLGRSGLQMEEVVGLGPRASRPRVLLDFVRANRRSISYGELSRRLDVGRVKSTSMSYMGFATKTG